MSPAEYTQKKEQIAKMGQEITKAEGAKEEIMKRLKADFKINSVDELNAKIKALTTEKAELSETLEALYDKLDALLDWDKV